MLEVQRFDACPFGQPGRVVQVRITFGAADNHFSGTVGVDQFLVAPDAAVVGAVERAEALVKGCAGDGSAQIFEIVLDIEQPATGFAGEN